MIELPRALRDHFVEAMDEYLDERGEPSDVETAVQAILERLGQATEAVDFSDLDQLSSLLEVSGQLESSLEEVVEDAIESSRTFEYTTDDIISLIETLCEIEWLSDETADEAQPISGFFEAGFGEENEDEE